MAEPVNTTDRPELSMPLSSLEKYLELSAILGVVIIIYLVLKYWAVLPESVPTHFDFSGRADAWSGRNSILFEPLLGIAFYLGLSWLSRFPHKFNYPVPITKANARRQYQLARAMLAMLKVELVCLFTCLAWMTIRVALGQVAGLGSAFLPVLLIVVFATLIWFLYQSYRLR